MASQALVGGFNLHCQDANEHEIGISLGAKQVDGQLFHYIPENIEPSLVNDAYKLAPFDKRARVKTIVFRGNNWIGRAITIDDTTGDERTRARSFRFCLIHSSQALCGQTPVAWLARLKANDLGKVKVILQSVDFVDTRGPGLEAVEQMGR